MSSAAHRTRTGTGPAAGANHRDFRRDIQGLRALAVILVIGNHAGLPGFSGGYIGVDVFFVISGYVITGLLLRETDKGIGAGLADFYSRRIRRIVPAATVTLIGTLVAAWLVLGSRIDPRLPGDVRWAALFGANVRFVATGSNYFVAGVHPSLVTQFWSLAVEEQFYLAFPVVVFVVARLSPSRYRATALMTTLAIAIALSAWWSLRISGTNPVVAYYSPLTRFWELGLGCLLATATAARPIPSARKSRWVAAAGVAVLVVALATLNPTSVYPGWHAWMPCGAAALLVWAGASPDGSPATRVLASRPFCYVGNISYSLYLTHYAWLELMRSSPLLGAWEWRLLALGAANLSAVCLYHFIENPVRRSPELAADGVAVVLILGVCVAASWTAATSVAIATNFT